MDHDLSDWFEDESFWTEMFPFMFPEKGFAAAAEDVPRIAALTGVTSGDVLDLACGPGRFAVPFAQAGYAVTGVDRSPYLLERARALASSAGANVELVESDMREFVRPATFDLAINVFTSFGYFDDPADNRRVLENVYSSLKPGGVFLFDHLGKEILAKRFQPTLSDALPDGTLRIQRIMIVDDWSRVEGEWILVRGDRATVFRNRHWIYSGQEIRELLARVGFAEISLYGSFAGTPYDRSAQRLIAAARKPSG